MTADELRDEAIGVHRTDVPLTVAEVRDDLVGFQKKLNTLLNTIRNLEAMDGRLSQKLENLDADFETVLKGFDARIEEMEQRMKRLEKKR
jgi:predicted  nucleic acid-binding Zn-ribbon protein